MKPIKALQQSKLFANLDESILNSLVRKSGSISSLKTNESLFREGDTGSFFYILLNGEVRLYKNSLDGKEATIKLVTPGESFAEIILFERGTYPVSARALKDSKVFRIDRIILMQFFEDEKFRICFMANLMKKLRYLTQQVQLLTHGDIQDRFFFFLAKQYGKHESYTIDSPKKDIAQSIGTIPETFSRMISKLKKNGTIISWEKNLLVINKVFWIEKYTCNKMK